LFIDFETCCRGPVEFDLAHVPEAVCEHYRALTKDCWTSPALVLAMVAAWRWDRGDEFPNGRWFGEEFLRTCARSSVADLDTVTRRLDAL